MDINFYIKLLIYYQLIVYLFSHIWINKIKENKGRKKYKKADKNRDLYLKINNVIHKWAEHISERNTKIAHLYYDIIFINYFTMRIWIKKIIKLKLF